MTSRSPRTILAFSAALTLTVAALAPTAALAKGPNAGNGDCDGDCTAEAPQVQQVRARDGSGTNQASRTNANAGGGGQVQARAASATETQTQVRAGNARNVQQSRTSRVDRNANANGARLNAKGNGQNAKDGAGQGPNDDGQRGPGTCDDCDAEMGTLTAEQEQGLVFMVEEEKLAHDIYAAFAEQYDVPIFGNIADSELRHQEAVGVVLERYGIDISDLPQGSGEFSNPILGSAYAAFLDEGSASLEAAIGVGVKIEQMDISDLESRLGDLEESAPDVYEMYSHLLAGSQNHLVAFEGWL